MHPDDDDDQAAEPATHPHIDALIARRDAAYFQLDTSIVIMSAEQPVMLSRINDLAADTDRARLRLANAHDHLAAVEQHHANPDIIAAARRDVDGRRDELDRIALANTNEATALMDQGLANLDVAMANKRIADAAHQAWLDAITPQTPDADTT